MEVYRIAKKEHADLTGAGGLHSAGRWHSLGRSVTYTASSRALAMLERMVHDSTDILTVDLKLMIIHVPDELAITRFTVSELPTGWNAIPETMASRSIGDQWLASAKTAALHVPSALCQDEFNVVLDPFHREHDRIKLIETKPFRYEPRLAGLLR